MKVGRISQGDDFCYKGGEQNITNRYIFSSQLLLRSKVLSLENRGSTRICGQKHLFQSCKRMLCSGSCKTSPKMLVSSGWAGNKGGGCWTVHVNCFSSWRDIHVHGAFNNCRWCIRFMLTSLNLEVGKALFLRLRMLLLSNTLFFIY